MSWSLTCIYVYSSVFSPVFLYLYLYVFLFLFPFLHLINNYIHIVSVFFPLKTGLRIRNLKKTNNSHSVTVIVFRIQTPSKIKLNFLNDQSYEKKKLSTICIRIFRVVSGFFLGSDPDVQPCGRKRPE